MLKGKKKAWSSLAKTVLPFWYQERFYIIEVDFVVVKAIPTRLWR